MLLASTMCLALTVGATDQPLPRDVQLAVGSLRDGERRSVEQALGPIANLPMYRAELDFDPRTRVVSGTVVLTVSAQKKAIDEIFLRSTPNANNAGLVKVTAPKVNGAVAKIEQPEDSLFRVVLPTAVPVGGTATLELKVSSTVPDASGDGDELPMDPSAMEERGGDYGAYSSTPSVSCLAGIVPMMPFVRPDGKLAEGPSGIGDLGTFDPSHFVISMTVPTGYSVVAPGNQLGEVAEGQKTRFTYTVAAARELPILVTRGYNVSTATVGDIVVESHYGAKEAKSGRQVLEHAVNALRVAQAKLGPYPYQRFRVVQAHLSNGAGGMEFPGLITVATSLYRAAADPMGVSGLSNVVQNPLLGPLIAQYLQATLVNTLEFTVDHEVAHQYIAMLVGSDPIAEPIADEALTQALALMIMQWQNKPELASEIRTSQVKMAFQMMRMMGHEDAKANRPTSTFKTNGEYAGLIYGKAPLYFDAVRNRVGPLVYERALRQYVDENRYRWVTAKTFTAMVGKIAQADGPYLERLRHRWWDEKFGDVDIGPADLEALIGGTGEEKPGAPKQPKGSGNPLGEIGLDRSAIDQYNAAMKSLMDE